MMSLGPAIRRLLLKRGLMLHRVGTDGPTGVAAYLGSLRARGITQACCFDNELTIQSELLGVFSEDDVTFFYPIFAESGGSLAQGSSWPTRPTGRFVATIDLDSLTIGAVLSHLPWLSEAEAVLVRASVGTFWSGARDWHQIDESLTQLGFQNKELVDAPFTTPLRAPAGRIVFAWDRRTEHPPTRANRRRVLETATYLSLPVVRRGEITLLAGRGSFGFPAGVYNPGAASHAGKSLLLARGEQVPWPLLKADSSRFFRSSGAVLLELDSEHRVESGAAVTVDHFTPASPSRVEDFRLFSFRGQIVSNHVVISAALPAQSGPALRLDQMQTRIAIAVLDPVERRLKWRGLPSIDRPLQQTEKNWGMFASGDNLYLLYSFAPYTLLRCTDWETLRFETVLNREVAVPFSGDGLSLRNSINPIDYDDRHWLHVVHRVYPDKQYTFWPVLIDKTSLLPARVGRCPVACSGRSHAASILYLSSALPAKEHVDFFFGLDDAALGWCRVTRERLDRNWAPVEATK